MGDFKWSEVCRVCATPKTNVKLRSLFDGNGENARMLQSISGIDISMDEGKRCAMICNICSKQVEHAFHVRADIIESEQKYFKSFRDQEEGRGTEELSIKQEPVEADECGELSVKEEPPQEEDPTNNSMAANTLIQQCRICHKSYKGIFGLRLHLSTAHADAAYGRFKCEHCSKKFYFKFNLDIHKVSHKGRREVLTKKSLKPVLKQRKATARGRKAFRKKCRFCTKTFTDNKALLYHLSNTHADTSNARFQCDLCPKKFHFKSHMKKHLANHRNIKNWRQCPEMDCGRFFHSDFHAKIHAIYHSNVRPFVCWCEKAFKFEHSLHFHQRRLHPEADHFRHICPVEGCKESFGRKSDLYQHFIVHPDYRPFKCPTCGQSFKNRGQVYKHQQIHQR